jgi:hypothetical protein
MFVKLFKSALSTVKSREPSTDRKITRIMYVMVKGFRQGSFDLFQGLITEFVEKGSTEPLK